MTNSKHVLLMKTSNVLVIASEIKVEIEIKAYRNHNTFMEY